MKRRIVASVLAFVGAAFILAYGVCAGVAGNLLEYGLAKIISAAAVAGVSAGLLIAGGLLCLLNKKYAFILAVGGLLLAFLVIVPLCFIGFNPAESAGVTVVQVKKWLKNLMLASRIIAPVAAIAALIIMPKFKGAVYCVTCLFPLLTALVLGCYVYFRLTSKTYMVVFIILGALGGLFAALGGVFTHKKREGAFSMLLMALMVMAGQFIIACAMCTQLNGVGNMILAFCGLIMTIIGGILVADTNESGFIIVSFGIILLLGWILYTMFLVNKAIALGLLCVMVSIILAAAVVLGARTKKEE